jgi:hypothetical protein
MKAQRSELVILDQSMCVCWSNLVTIKMVLDGIVKGLEDRQEEKVGSVLE